MRTDRGALWPVVVAVGAVGLLVTSLIATSSDWGPPGTAEYDRYKMLNRRAAIPAALLLVGLSAAWRRRRAGSGAARLALGLSLVGAALVLLGNIGEFWWFTSAAYGDPWRNLAWTAFAFGVLALLAGVVLGAAAWTAARWRRSRAGRGARPADADVGPPGQASRS